jgi:hypothetical protein
MAIIPFSLEGFQVGLESGLGSSRQLLKACQDGGPSTADLSTAVMKLLDLCDSMHLSSFPSLDLFFLLCIYRSCPSTLEESPLVVADPHKTRNARFDRGALSNSTLRCIPRNHTTCAKSCPQLPFLPLLFACVFSKWREA